MEPPFQLVNTFGLSSPNESQWTNLLLEGDIFHILHIFESCRKEKIRFKLIFLDLPVYFNNQHFEPLFSLDMDREKLIEFKRNNNNLVLIQGNLREYLVSLKTLFQLSKSYLANDGFLAVKVNNGQSSELKIVLDQVFNPSHFVNEIIVNSPIEWKNKDQSLLLRTNKILLYSPAETPRINPIFNEKESGGYWHTFMSDGQGKPKIFTIDGEKIEIAPPPGTHWKLSQQRIDEKCAIGEIRLNKRKQPEYWVPKKKGQIVGNNWLDISSFELNSWGYVETSSNFLERLIKLCTNEKDMLGCFFCQFGQGLVVAEKLDRYWVGIDINESTSALTVQRLQENSAAFIHYKLGNMKKFSDTTSKSHSIDTGLFTSLFEESNNQKQTLMKDNSFSLKLIEKHQFFKQKVVIQTSLTKFSPNTEEEDKNKRQWANKLIWGDNLNVLRDLTKDHRKLIQMIYIDPPFFTGTDYNITIPVLDEDSSPIEEFAYNNIWKEPENLSSFMKWFEERICLMKDLLRNEGFIFVRFDYHYGHYAKQVLDKVFGKENFCNEYLIRRMIKNLSKKQMYRQKHLIVQFDSLFLYQKTRESKLTGKVKKVRRKGGDPIETERMNDNIWLDISGYQKTKQTLYPSENSEVLLERVIKLSTNEGDIVADFFSGSGTTLAVAEKLKRRWIGVDIGKFAIHESKKRMLRIFNSKPFLVFQAMESSHCTTKSHDIGSLKVDVKIKKQQVKIGLVDYIIKPNSLKTKTPQNKRNVSDLIDYWAIDWDYRNKVFHNRWCSYREFTRRRVKSRIKLGAEHEYQKLGDYEVLIKVVDVGGNEITKAIPISITVLTS